MDVLVTDNVVKRFEGHTALSGVSINVPEGSIFGLLGPNGAGKSTLLRIINQITAPDSGAVYLQGRPIEPADVLKIGYLPEERGLYRKMMVGEQALYLARLKGMSKEDALKALKFWFKKFDIEGWWRKKVSELSKGMAQKVQFITTVLHNPPLLILDEPFSGFDPINAEIIRTHILDLKKQGVSIILSTHNMDSVEELCDNIALINKSKLVITGGVNEVRHKYGDNKIEVMYRAGEQIADFASEGRYITYLSDKQEDCYRLIIDRQPEVATNAILRDLMEKVDIVAVKEVIPRMKDIFIKLVTE